MPACMSAMKKLSASSGRSPRFARTASFPFVLALWVIEGSPQTSARLTLEESPAPPACQSWARWPESVEQLQCGICARPHRLLVCALDVDHVVATSEPEMRRRRRWRRRFASPWGWRRRRAARVVSLIVAPRRRWRRRTCGRTARGRWRRTGVCAWGRRRRRSELALHGRAQNQ